MNLSFWDFKNNLIFKKQIWNVKLRVPLTVILLRVFNFSNIWKFLLFKYKKNKNVY